jgi:hypothetical protein
MLTGNRISCTQQLTPKIPWRLSSSTEPLRRNRTLPLPVNRLEVKPRGIRPAPPVDYTRPIVEDGEYNILGTTQVVTAASLGDPDAAAQTE